MNFEDTKIGKTYMIKIEGLAGEIEVYRHKNKQVFVNANDCSTNYEKNRCSYIREVK